MMPYFIQSSCTKCGVCLFECPSASIVEGKDTYVIDVDTCADHQSCVAVCPVDAIISWSLKQDSDAAADKAKPGSK